MTVFHKVEASLLSELMMRRAFLLIAAMVAMGCGDTTGPEPAVVVTVSEQSVEQSTSGSLTLSFHAKVENITSRPVYQMGCSGSLERGTPAGEWVPVWSVACLLVTGNDVVIPPNQSRVIPMMIDVASTDSILPSPGQEATYRFRMGVLVENDLAAIRFKYGRIAQQVTSNEFQVARP